MDKEQEKKLKEVLKGEFLPLFVGLRNELKNLGIQLEQLILKAPPEIQKTEVTNQITPSVNMVVDNFPDIQKTEITNYPEPVKEIDVKKIDDVIGATKGTNILLGSVWKAITEGLANLKNSILKVEVQNQQEFPKSIRIDNLDEIAKAEPVVIPQQFKISNSQPSEAIPVVMTTADRKSFYNAIQQVIAGNDIDLSGVKSLLADIKTAVQNIDIDADSINLNTDTLEALIAATNATVVLIKSNLDIIIALLGGTSGTFESFGEISLSTTTETTIASFTVPVGKTAILKYVTIEGESASVFKIYKDSILKWSGRIEQTFPTFNASLLLESSAAVVLTLKVIPDNAGLATRKFRGTISGSLI